MGPISNPDKPAVQEEVLEEKIMEEEPDLSSIPEGNESSSEAAPVEAEAAPIEAAPVEAEAAPIEAEVAPVEAEAAVAPVIETPVVETVAVAPAVVPVPKLSGLKKIGKRSAAANQA
jgi:hypothetical protein